MTVVQHRVCEHRNGRHAFTLMTNAENALSRQCDAAQHTFLIAIDFIRAVVLAVVEVVTAKDGADATAISALELILLAYWCGRSYFWWSIVAKKT